MLDRWTLVHFAFWFVIGANYVWHSIPILLAVAITLIGAYLWEVIELLLERYNVVSGSETNVNRWISDPLISLIGAAAGALWILF